MNIENPNTNVAFVIVIAIILIFAVRFINKKIEEKKKKKHQEKYDHYVEGILENSFGKFTIDLAVDYSDKKQIARGIGLKIANLIQDDANYDLKEVFVNLGISTIDHQIGETKKTLILIAYFLKRFINMKDIKKLETDKANKEIVHDVEKLLETNFCNF